MIAPNWLSKPRVVAVVDADRFLLFRVDYRRRKQSAEPYFEHRGLDAGWAWLATAATEAADEGLVPPEESIDLVLMRPLVSTRALALPPCRRSILRALLGANLNRYFPWGDDAAVVDAWSSRQHGKRRRHVAAAGVSAETVAGILDALTAGGLRIRRVLAAPMAAAHAVGQLQRETNGRLADAVVVVFGRDLCELIGFVDGEPTSFIPLPMGASVETDATALDHALEVMTEPSEPSLCLACGDMDAAQPRIRQAAATFDVLDVAGITSLEAAAALGAAHLGAEAPDLSPTALRAGHDRSRRWRTVLAVGVACVAVLAAAQLHLTDLRRELATTSEAREYLASTVEEASRSRRATDLAWSVADELSEYENSRPDWTSFVASLAAALPSSVFVTRLEATSDSVVIAGETTEGTELPLYLTGTRAVDGVPLTATTDGSDSERRFTARFAIPSDDIVGPPTAGSDR